MSQIISETELSPRPPSPSQEVTIPSHASALDPSNNNNNNTTNDDDDDNNNNDSSLLPPLRPVTPRRQALILLSSFLTICVTIGFNQSYGVFQSYYTSPGQTLLRQPPATAATVAADARTQGAWIAFVGTLGAGLTWAGSVAVNPLMARVRDVRWLTVAGVVCMSAGFGLASLASEVSWPLRS